MAKTKKIRVSTANMSWQKNKKPVKDVVVKPVEKPATYLSILGKYKFGEHIINVIWCKGNPETVDKKTVYKNGYLEYGRIKPLGYNSAFAKVKEKSIRLGIMFSGIIKIK